MFREENEQHLRQIDGSVASKKLYIEGRKLLLEEKKREMQREERRESITERNKLAHTYATISA